MTKFSEFEYKRPDMSAAKRRLRALTKAVTNAASFGDVERAILDFSRFEDELQTQMSLAHIRHTINIEDRFYEKEQAFFDRAIPAATPYMLKWYKAILGTKFRVDIDKRFGVQYLLGAEKEANAMSPKLITDMVHENKLSTQYQKLLASCKVEFNGEICNLSGLGKYRQSADREIRRQAAEAASSFYKEHEKELDSIYDKLVKLRTKMGRKLGFTDYTPLGYLRMGRTFTPADAASFREQVAKYLVPMCTKIHEKQAARIGVDSLKVYDEPFEFTDGNATPDGDRQFMVDCAQRMYRELSPETGEFFDDMVARELMDLETKPAKRVGGYCTALPCFHAPFIFSNFNGTSSDVEVLTHEAGHAFAGVMVSKTQELNEYTSPTMEVAEIHSMSMEFFTHRWMNLFFGDKGADKYRYSHLVEALTFVPYGVCVDEFQHIVYANPEMTPAERKAAWAKLEKKYLPDRDYDGDEFMQKGSFWQKQHHIYSMPFYYIDYTLASMGAFEFYGKMNENRESAWTEYLALCRAGGSLPYRELLALANLSDPFSDGGVERASAAVVKAIFDTDDAALQGKE